MAIFDWDKKNLRDFFTKNRYKIGGPVILLLVILIIAD